MEALRRKRVALDQVRGFEAGREVEREGARTGIELEEAGLLGHPRFQVVEELVEEGQVRLAKGAGVELDGGAADLLWEERRTGKVVPGGSEDGVGAVGLEVEPHRAGKRKGDRLLGIEDEGELCFACDAGDLKLDVAEEAGVGGLVVRGQARKGGDRAVEGGVVHLAVRNGEDVVGAPFKEADRVAHREFRAVAPAAASAGNERNRRAPKELELAVDRGRRPVGIEGAAGAGAKVDAING